MKRNSEHDGDNIPWKERAKIRHEINTYYSKYAGKSVIWHRSIGLDGCYYVYIVENHEFDDYMMIARIPDTEVH